MRRTDDVIFFRETGARTVDFLHELSDPELVRPRGLEPDVQERLREAQVARLEENIGRLRKKQDEFNRRMEQYIANLHLLVQGLTERPAGEAAPEAAAAAESAGTWVRCTGCRAEKVFRDLRVIFARESDESLNRPTECYVTHEGEIKKGTFLCRDCGSGALTIRPE